MSLFLMRAYRTTVPTGFVYWQVPDVPDTSGALAPVPAVELTDILVVAVYPKEGGDVSFTLVASEAVSAGQFVAVTAAGLAQKADATVAGRYPAVGICTAGAALAGLNAAVVPIGPTTLLSGLTPGATYYLGTSGAAVTAPPVGALAAQPVIQALTTSSAILLTSSISIGTPV